MTKHDYYLVVDFEATCCNQGSFPRAEMEIIEIGAVIVSAANCQPVAEYQSFVKPLRNPELTDFCLSLTNIAQEMVNNAPLFPDALTAFNDWWGQFAPVLFCSWGNYDRTQLRSDCEFHGVDYPFGDSHANLKQLFAAATGRKPQGIPGALQRVGLSFTGSHHRGIDDARNIASLIPYIFPAHRLA